MGKISIHWAVVAYERGSTGAKATEVVRGREGRGE